jgi:hypothetical protein
VPAWRVTNRSLSLLVAVITILTLLAHLEQVTSAALRTMLRHKQKLIFLLCWNIISNRSQRKLVQGSRMGIWKVRSGFLYPYGKGYSCHTECKGNINTAQDGERDTGEDRAALVVNL